MELSWSCLLAMVVLASIKGMMSESKKLDLAKLKYLEYPRRTEDEAAVLEWGHSAIISALDASVAYFGPQTSQAALLEVECQPILASPINGVFAGGGGGLEEDEDGNLKAVIKPLDNADDVHGNMVVMTNTGGLTGLEMAKIAKKSRAAALLVVNIDEDRPDDIYRLEVGPDSNGVDDIDIPVVMISMNSANVLTSATVEPGMDPEDIVNHGMPERVRLYAGDDRPFFEDVEPIDPTLYLIHNLLSEEECDNLVEAAKPLVTPVKKDDFLQYTYSAKDFVHVDRVLLWQGMLQTPARKSIEERIEQVTGFPSNHFSDFVIDRLQPGSSWDQHLDAPHPSMPPPLATITIFLTDDSGPMLYPKCPTPVQVNCRKGLAVVHHNRNDRHGGMDSKTRIQLDPKTLHALRGPKDGPIYVARKFVFAEPITTARKLALPVFALPFGGKLPGPIVQLHEMLVEQVGMETGDFFLTR